MLHLSEKIKPINKDSQTGSSQHKELQNLFLSFVKSYHNKDWDWIDENSLDVELVDVFLDYIWKEEYFQMFEDMFNQCISILQQTNDYEKTLNQLIDDCYDFCDLYLEDYIDVYEPLDVCDVYHLAILLTKYICGVE